MLEAEKRRDGQPRRLKRFIGERSGASALEFAILAPVFFGLVIAIVETFTAYLAEQVLLDANDAVARSIRMGHITFNMDRPTDVDREEFRKIYCENLTVLLSCSPEEADIPSRLYIDVRSTTTFDVPNTTPSPLPNHFAPGGKATKNIVRAYYRWPVLVDYLRVLTFWRGSTSSVDEQLLVATTVFKNEDYQ